MDAAQALCGLHAVDLDSGVIRGSYVWPSGDQIFAIEPVPTRFSAGFPFTLDGDEQEARALFFTFVRGHQR